MQPDMLSANQVVAWLQTLTPAQGKPIGQLSGDSRRIQIGDIFFAYPNGSADGRHYISDAIERGAAAIVYEAAGYQWLDEHDLPHLAVASLKQLAGAVANVYYKTPDKDMFTVAVTGTNGKTSCSYWLGMALSRLQGSSAPAAVVGTLGVGMFQDGKPHAFDVTGYTTPDA